MKDTQSLFSDEDHESGHLEYIDNPSIFEGSSQNSSAESMITHSNNNSPFDIFDN